MSSKQHRSIGFVVPVLAAAVVVLLIVSAVSWPRLREAFDESPSGSEVSRTSAEDHDHAAHDHGDHEGHDHDDHDHEGHDHAGHDHEGHVEEESVELSEAARANLGLRTQALKLGDFDEHMDIPAAVVDWPGRTHVTVTSPLTGVINSIQISRGELIRSGMPMFTLRLTHQDLVNTQERFLTALGQRDIERREIERLSEISSSGAIAGKRLIEREYERDRLLAELKVAKQSMLLHGLTEEQVRSIEQTRQLVREVTIHAPTLHADRSLHHDSLHSPDLGETAFRDDRFASMQPPSVAHDHVESEFLVTQLQVHRGDSVTAGQPLGRLSDYSEVLVEGFAYQRDAEVLRQVAQRDADVQAVFESRRGESTIVSGLKIAYIGNEVNLQSRALSFYVALENELERDQQVGAKKYVSWRFKPGQRLQLQIPVRQIEDVVVVPKNAVAEEGAERYVFIQYGDHFDRIPVHVAASDSMHVAIRPDERLRLGSQVVIDGAYQLQMAMKNRSGGAIDPHAGHSH